MSAPAKRRDLEDALVAVEAPSRRIDSSLWPERVLASELRRMRCFDLPDLIPFLIFFAGFAAGVFLLKVVAG